MRKFGIFLVVAALLIAGGVAWYRHAYPTYTYRFRLAIAVDVGGQAKTASSVIGVRTVTQPLSPMVSPIRNEVHGNAVFLDLGLGRNVVALLGCNPNGTQDCIESLVPSEFGISGLKNLPQLENLRGVRELTGKFMPTLVTFGDLTDPESARVVAPDRFEQVFGPDVHFNRIWIEMTTDPVTKGIEREMPMLVSHRDSMRRAYSDPSRFTAQYHLFSKS